MVAPLRLDAQALDLLKLAMRDMNFSARAYGRILKVCPNARTDPVASRHGRTLVHPLAQFSSGLLLCQGWLCAALARIPGGGHQRIFRNVADNFVQRPAPVLLRVLELARQFRRRFSFEHHPIVRRRQMPFGMSRRHVLAGSAVDRGHKAMHSHLAVRPLGIGTRSAARPAPAPRPVTA